MYYQKIKERNNPRNMIDTWLGLNHNHKIGQGEFYNVMNTSTRAFPLLTCRNKRYELSQGNFRGIKMVDGTIYVLDGKSLVQKGLNDVEIDLSDYLDDDESEQTLLNMGGYMIIHPANVYVNLNDYEDKGKMGAEVSANTTVNYSVCTVEGGQLQNLKASFLAPENAQNGDYWLCNDPEKAGLYMYVGYQSAWQPIAVSYIKIESEDIDFSVFSVGDGIVMNTKYQDINNGSVITSIGDDYIIVIGLMNKVTDTETKEFKFERRIPKMDYVCVDKNRMWGCHYGYDSKTRSVINEIYASKLGDFKNFYVYSGITTDSYAVTVGEQGAFTGCISYQGCPIFFKENKVYKIYGDYPSNYSVNDTTLEGVQNGSGKSLAVCGEYLIYKGTNSVCMYDGSWATPISNALGKNEIYFGAVGGCCNNKYYMTCEKDNYYMFVYDVENGIWTREDYIPINAFSESVNGQLYAITDHILYGLGEHTNQIYLKENILDEEWVDWVAETGEMGFETPDYKYVSRITLRAYIPVRSEIQVELSYDDRPYDVIGTFRGADNIISQSLAFAPFRCDHYKIKFSGHGESRIYSLAITLETESEEDATY